MSSRTTGKVLVYFLLNAAVLIFVALPLAIAGFPWVMLVNAALIVVGALALLAYVTYLFWNEEL